jgi:YidC/Oxa1 family membrane protein insertase
MADNKNLILAFLLSLVILLGFDLLYVKPKREAEAERLAAQQTEQVDDAVNATDAALPKPSLSEGSVPTVAAAAQTVDRAEVLAQSPRIAIDSDRLKGSISLVGGRIDDLILSDYRETLDKDAAPVTLLSPAGAPDTYYADFGWAAAGHGLELPGRDTRWTTSDTVLRSGGKVTLTWTNSAGVTFVREIALDDAYMFSVTQRIENNSSVTVKVAPYALISRHGHPKTQGTYILHEGPIGVFGEVLNEMSYKDIEEDGRMEQSAIGGWLGITDKYWLTALVPDQNQPYKGAFSFAGAGGVKRYQVDYIMDTRSVAPGAATEVTSRLFAGAKVVSLLDRYEKTYGISRFDRGVDWGWFYWITKPIFYTLHYFHGLFGNFGLAILALTVILKLLFFPLANKSYVAMSKMKLLQPKMLAIKERYGDDRLRMQQEMMELYKKEKVNPMAGCLPILLQIPVFFALYKVLYVTLEMRHAPFYGWVKDLSAPDPLTFVNLFGLIPWDPPQVIAIGIWPVLMGLTMFLQMKMNPTPPDPVQAKVMMFMPLIFTFVLAPFPVGLVIYWTWNNLLSILQQWVIMRRMEAAPAAT